MNPNLAEFLANNPCPYDFQTSLQNILAQNNTNDDGFIAMGGDLNPSTLMSAYSQGLFPWFNAGEPIAWYSPQPRCLIYPHAFTLRKSLTRTIKAQNWIITINRDFSKVIQACGEARAYADSTWINPDMIVAYNELNKIGFAHSVEVWQGHWEDEPSDHNLIGGLYGLKLGQAFFGESMFHRATDASKVAFLALMRLCAVSGFAWVDCQLPNEHLLSLGATILSRENFLAQLSTQIHLPSCDWSGLVGDHFLAKDLLENLPFKNINNQLILE